MSILLLVMLLTVCCRVVGGLDDTLMERVLDKYRLYKATGSQEVHGDFFSSLLEVDNTWLVQCLKVLLS